MKAKLQKKRSKRCIFSVGMSWPMVYAIEDAANGLSVSKNFFIKEAVKEKILRMQNLVKKSEKQEVCVHDAPLDQKCLLCEYQNGKAKK